MRGSSSVRGGLARRGQQLVTSALCAASFLTGQLLLGDEPVIAPAAVPAAFPAAFPPAAAPQTVLNQFVQAAAREGEAPAEPKGSGFGVQGSGRATLQPAAILPIENHTLKNHTLDNPKIIINPTIEGTLPRIISPAEAKPLRGAKPLQSAPPSTAGPASSGTRESGDRSQESEVGDRESGVGSQESGDKSRGPKLIEARPLELGAPLTTHDSPLSPSADDGLPPIVPASAMPKRKETGDRSRESGVGNRESGVRSRESATGDRKQGTGADQPAAPAPWMQDIRGALNPDDRAAGPVRNQEAGVGKQEAGVGGRESDARSQEPAVGSQESGEESLAQHGSAGASPSHSPLTTHDSPLTKHGSAGASPSHSSLTTHDSPLTKHGSAGASPSDSRVTTHHSPATRLQPAQFTTDTTADTDDASLFTAQDAAARRQPAAPAAGPLPAGSPFEAIQQSGTVKLRVRRSILLRTKVDIYRTAIVDEGGLRHRAVHAPRSLDHRPQRMGQTHVTFWFDDPAMPPLTYLVEGRARRRAGQSTIEDKYQLLEDVINEMFPDSKIHLVIVADKLLVKGQAKDSEEAAQIMTIVRAQGQCRGA